MRIIVHSNWRWLIGGARTMGKVRLDLTSNHDYVPGKPLWYRILWIVVEALTLLNPVLLPSGIKRRILIAFGARIGTGVVIKPGVHVKHPWRLKIGDHCWIGERAWIDNLVPVTLGDHVCISQGAYLCTGNHDWTDPGMGMNPRPIVVQDGVWIGAFSQIGPGVTVGQMAILTLGSTLLHDTEPLGIYQGNPARRIKERRIEMPGAGSSRVG
jgi:putative colanic acid biosynthesis acetyltransferase WcaF